MATSATGAVFFLGPKAHYQVLQKSDSTYDLENGNTSCETIYQNTSTADGMWTDDGESSPKKDSLDNSVGYGKWGNSDDDDFGGINLGGGITRRFKRRDDQNDNMIEIDPTMLNDYDSDSPKSKERRAVRPCMNIRAFISTLRSGRRRFVEGSNVGSSLTLCTYKDSCRCMDCQSSYFDCDESDISDSECDEEYEPSPPGGAGSVQSLQESDDEEVFVNAVPKENKSRDVHQENRRNTSVSTDSSAQDETDEMKLEMAAGTPVVLDYLLNHPLSCVIM